MLLRTKWNEVLSREVNVLKEILKIALAAVGEACEDAKPEFTMVNEDFKDECNEAHDREGNF